jgi:hypothetical protein
LATLGWDEPAFFETVGAARPVSLLRFSQHFLVGKQPGEK